MLKVKKTDIILCLLSVSLLSCCSSQGSSSVKEPISSVKDSEIVSSYTVSSVSDSSSSSSFFSSSFEDAPDSFTAEEILPRCRFYSFGNGNCRLEIDTFDKKSHTYDGYGNIGELTLPSFSPDGDRVVTFSYCHSFKKLHTIHLPLTLLEIDKQALMTYPRLRNVNISENVLRIRSEAFKNDASLPFIRLPKVKVIEESAFENCSGLKAVSFSEVLLEIHESAFKGCSGIYEMTLPSTLETLGAFAFEKNASLTSVVIPKKVKDISRGAFHDCHSLSSLTIEDGVESIEYDAFSRTALRKVFIPKSVKSISSTAFGNPDSPITLYCEAEKRPEGYEVNTSTKYVFHTTREEFDRLSR